MPISQLARHFKSLQWYGVTSAAHPKVKAEFFFPKKQWQMTFQSHDEATENLAGRHEVEQDFHQNVKQDTKQVRYEKWELSECSQKVKPTSFDDSQNRAHVEIEINQVDQNGHDDCRAQESEEMGTK